MNDFGLNEMQEIQKQLQEKYKDKWGGLSPDIGRNQLLWMMIEVGEVADIIKKKGDSNIMNDEETRNHFVEELCDVLMYFNDVMLCYSISPEELKKVYLQKHHKNIERW
ncbi:nucleotide pyrophosphohydrolase [Clostridium sp.]|uniref:nucleotide pyrophosphohydrolase n=1 Tax=Clostridium sp. TaxID=1506 RepID=UPI0032180057